MTSTTIARTAPRAAVAALALLIVAFSGFQARAQENQIALASPADQLALAPAHRAETEGTADASGLTQNNQAGWEDYYQSNLTTLNLDISNLNADAGSESRVVRIASCYEDSFGRYSAQGNTADAGPTATFDSFQSSMDRYNAQKNSRQQFETCAR